MFTTAYQSQTNEQMKRFDRTIQSMLRNYVSESQRDWDEWLEPLTYAYNKRVYRSTGPTPFDLVLTRLPPSLFMEKDLRKHSLQNILPKRRARIVSAKNGFFERFTALMQKARANLSGAQARYKCNFHASTRARLKDAKKVLDATAGLKSIQRECIPSWYPRWMSRLKAPRRLVAGRAEWETQVDVGEFSGRARHSTDSRELVWCWAIGYRGRRELSVTMAMFAASDCILAMVSYLRICEPISRLMKELSPAKYRLRASEMKRPSMASDRWLNQAVYFFQ